MRGGRHLLGGEAGLWHAEGLAHAVLVKPTLVSEGLMTPAQAGEGEGCEGDAHGLCVTGWVEGVAEPGVHGSCALRAGGCQAKM